MGNVLQHLCPTSKILLRTCRRYHSFANVGDTGHLYTNEICPSPELPKPKSAKQANGNESTCPNFSASSLTTMGPKVIKEHVNFPFLTNDELASWIVHSRFMFILRGPPGSGKSYITECIRVRFPTTVVCSADFFWYLESDGEEYQFDSNRLHEAHNWCQERATEAANAGLTPLVIDNTNMRAYEVRFYTDLARKYGYVVILVSPQTPWRFDIEALAIRNIHFVSADVIESRVRNFEHIFPLYYGWIWPNKRSAYGNSVMKFNNRKSSELVPIGDLNDIVPQINQTEEFLDWAWNALNIMIGLPDIRVQLCSTLGYADDVSLNTLLQHWCSATSPFGYGLQQTKASSLLHITTRFARFGHAVGAQQYGLSAVVSESLLGKLFTIQITGLFFSTRTVGARVRLSTDELDLRHLWGSDDQTVLSVDQNGFSDGMFNQRGRSKPNRPFGCRAHVTLALARDISSVECGLDLLRIVDAELENNPGEHIAIVPGGSVRRVCVCRPAPSPTRAFPNGSDFQFQTSPPGFEYMYVFDLDTPQHHRVLFAGIY